MLAAITGTGAREQPGFLVDAALRTPTLKRLLHISTTDVYGYPKTPCDENYPLTDVGLPYNRSKCLGEKAVADLLQQGSLPLIGGGRCGAGLIYVDDAVEGIIRAANSPKSMGQAYNLRNPESISWRQHAQSLADSLNFKRPWMSLPFAVARGFAALLEAGSRVLRVKRRPLLTRHAVYVLGRSQDYRVEKMRADLDYHPQTCHAQGVELAAEYYRRLVKDRCKERGRAN